MNSNYKTYLTIIKIKGKKLDEFYMTDKSSMAVKKVLKDFFMKIGNPNIEIEVDTIRVERIDGDYIEIK